MFSGVNDHLLLLQGMNGLELEFFQASDAGIDYSGRNRFPFNRLFAVWSVGDELSSIRSHSNGRTITMPPGALCFMSADSDLEFHFRRDTHFFAFHYRISVREYSLFSDLDLLEVRPEQQAVVDRIYGLFHREPPDAAGWCELKSIVLAATAAFLPPGTMVPVEHERYRPILAFIRNEADARTSVGELAKRFSASTDSFSRAFSRDFGMPVKHYLAQELTLKAGRFLQRDRFSIKEIAAMLRFSDEYYFSRFFKKSTGLAPSEYRRRFCRAEAV